MPLPVAHHDGSSRFTSHQYPAPGQRITLRMSTADQLAASRVVLRAMVDGEPQKLACHRVAAPTASQGEQWWEVSLDMANHRLGYRFLVDAPGGALVLNQRGTFRREVTDACDFRITCDPAVPQWASDGVAYQVFPDRFARGADEPYPEQLPDWAVAAGWDTPVASETPDGVRQFYGGTLAGVREHLDHLADLGVTILYLTPFFPARSNHRYDSTTFDRVDELLGGDEALRELTAAARERGIRVIGDLTLNHTGVTHEWFEQARGPVASAEDAFYLFEDDGDGPGYACFWDAPSLPKLDHRSPELRRRLYDGPDSVVARYVTDHGLAGWRIDVAQSAGIHRQVDLRDAVARTTRRTLDEAADRATGEGAYLVAEYNHDPSDALRGDGWQGTMAYSAFTKPVWSWLAGDVNSQWNSPVPLGLLDGVDLAETMDDFTALVPWRSRVASLNLLGSHDTARIRSAVGRDGQLLGLALMATLPGIPMVFAGDEVGVPGTGMEDSRRPFPWQGERDEAMLQHHRKLFALRHEHEALRRGGFRWVEVQPDVLVYERATAQERVVVQVARAEHDPVVAPWPLVSLLDGTAVAAGQRLPTGPGHHLWRVVDTAVA